MPVGVRELPVSMRGVEAEYVPDACMHVTLRSNRAIALPSPLQPRLDYVELATHKKPATSVEIELAQHAAESSNRGVEVELRCSHARTYRSG